MKQFQGRLCRFFYDIRKSSLGGEWLLNNKATLVQCKMTFYFRVNLAIASPNISKHINYISNIVRFDTNHDKNIAVVVLHFAEK
jgi:hypothetical protein